MNILCIHQGYELYGSDRSFIDDVRVLKEHFNDGEFLVLIPKVGPIFGPLKKVVANVMVSELAILRKSELKKLKLSALFEIFRFSRQNEKLFNQYEVVYINSIVLLGPILTKTLKSTKMVVHIREIPMGVSRWIFQFCLKISKAYFIFNSSATRHAFPQLDEKRCFVVNNGVIGFSDINSPKFEIPMRILMIGRINSWKGQLELLHAVCELNEQKRKSITVRIVGDVFENQYRFKTDLAKFVHDNNLMSLVEFFSFSDNPATHYQWSDIVVVPSTKPEPFGRVAIEAMSAARPVVAADHGGLSEIVVHNKTGILFKPKNQKSLRLALETLIDNPDLAIKMGQRGFTRFQENYTFDIHRRNFLSTVDQIIAKND